MQIKHILSALLFVFTLCFFGSNAFAQAADEGFDLRVGLSANILRYSYEWKDGSTINESDYTSEYNGFAGKISFGYRWEYVGVYIDQDLGGVWNADDDVDDFRDDEAHFLGGTFLVARGILPCTDQFMFDLGFGLGVMYSDGDKTKDIEEGNYKYPLIFNKDGNPSAAFAIKLSFSLAYFFTDTIGAGIYVDYNYAFKKNKSDYEVTYHYHVVNPGIQLIARF